MFALSSITSLGLNVQPKFTPPAALAAMAAPLPAFAVADAAKDYGSVVMHPATPSAVAGLFVAVVGAGVLMDKVFAVTAEQGCIISPEFGEVCGRLGDEEDAQECVLSDKHGWVCA